MKRKTFKWVIFSCSAAKQYTEMKRCERKKKNTSVRDRMQRRPFQRLPKDSAYFLIIQSQSPSTEVQHTAFYLFLSKNP